MFTYLTNRKQKVKVKSPNTTKHIFSDWGTLKHGVPQASILGPLFIIFINYLPLRINYISEPILFTDDTSVIISSRDFEDLSFYSSFSSGMTVLCEH